MPPRSPDLGTPLGHTCTRIVTALPRPTWHEYACSMSEPGTWGGNLEVQAAADVLGIGITVITPDT
eukprot:5741871-Heterocapsa_arctica.AAC.1